MYAQDANTQVNYSYAFKKNVKLFLPPGSEFLCAALDVTELTLGTRLSWNSDPPSSGSQVLGLKACITTAWLRKFFKFVKVPKTHSQSKYSGGSGVTHLVILSL